MDELAHEIKSEVDRKTTLAKASLSTQLETLHDQLDGMILEHEYGLESASMALVNGIPLDFTREDIEAVLKYDFIFDASWILDALPTPKLTLTVKNLQISS
jgi:hypothetical protein